MPDRELLANAHWFDRFTMAVAASQMSRRSAFRLAFGLGISGAPALAWGQNRARPGQAAPIPRRPGVPAVPNPPPTRQPPPPVQSPGAPPGPPTPGRCVANSDGRRAGIEFAAQAAFQGKPLTLTYTFNRSEAGNIVGRVLVQLAGETVLEMNWSASIRPPYHAEGHLQLGPQFNGPKTLQFTTSDGKIAQGTLDGRRLLPFAANAPASALRFADGGTLPPAGPLPPDLKAALDGLLGNARTLAGSCRPTPAVNRTGVPRLRRDDSHKSAPWNTSACSTCDDACYVSTGFGILGAIISAITGGPAAAAGAAVGVVSTASFCINVCARGPCCPVVCSKNPIPPGITTPAVPPSCCDSGEICLNLDAGLCCNQGQSPCGQQFCCDPGDVCLPNGCCPVDQLCNNNSTCCPDGSICNPDNNHTPDPDGSICCAKDVVGCGNKCCPDHRYYCRNGTCCLPGRECGDICCDELATCIQNNPAGPLCCAFASPACGGKCCAHGDVCVNNSECCHPAQHCMLQDGSSLCCPPNHICDIATHTCSTSACSGGQVPCSPSPAGPNLCCPDGHSCCNGACCPDMNQICCQPVGGLGQTNGNFGCNLSIYCVQ
jgi:hypothetical protein